MLINIKNQKGGFLVLTMVLIVSAVVLTVSTGIFLRSISELTESGDSEMSLRAWAAVNACGETAVMGLASTTLGNGWSTYTGDVELPVGDETCYIYIIETSGTDKIIKASSTVSSFTRKIQVTVATNTPSLVVSAWEEVADF